MKRVLTHTVSPLFVFAVVLCCSTPLAIVRFSCTSSVRQTFVGEGKHTANTFVGYSRAKVWKL